MKKTLVFLLVGVVGLALLTPLITAQTIPAAISTSRVAWDQPADSLDDANALVATAYFDTAPGVLVAKTCTGTGPFVCTMGLPSTLSKGQHTVTLVVADSEFASLPSTVLTFRFTAPPAAPLNPRIVK